eukprot:7133787-Alexandrium_andersonii.AAC.1
MDFVSGFAFPGEGSILHESCNMVRGPSRVADWCAPALLASYVVHSSCGTWSSCCHAGSPPTAPDSSGS